ncbi:MAG: hypothetical protein J5950_02105 [Clostridia bacterium]|nr:hypothetical protein [Clostridia bacterium]
MDIDAKIKKFKIDLLKKMPFYGDIVLRLPIVRNDNIPTARTNGRSIEYNGNFMASLKEGQRNFIFMHEVFHVLLHHCSRSKGRDPRLWNTAADIIVNDMLLRLRYDLNRQGIPFEKPDNGIFDNVAQGASVETIYETLVKNNRRMQSDSKMFVFGIKGSNRIEVPDDLIILSGEGAGGSGDPAAEINGVSVPGDQDGLSESMIDQIIREAVQKNRSAFGSFFAPRELIELTETKRLNWKTLLRDFLEEDLNDEPSYTTPEKKYIHMDLILPGYSMTEEKIEEIWAFVDSSGSIGNDEMKQFITQLYRVSKEFKCAMNLCYWDTRVTDVYLNIPNEKELLKCLPKHSGGTDINCVYSWLRENKIRPEVMLILTDGYFGHLDHSVFIPSMGRKTILVLSPGIVINDEMKKIGKIATL